ncbi:glutamine synthetase family protein [Amycolatopsis sp. lyj-90]|uniref:glutamine synthetase family protein n=1 Tax=Amycolatopsis sp. lyj-90 TaxID=2789285 RepID=UPI003978BEC3
MTSRQWSNPCPGSSVGLPGFVARHGLWDDEQQAAAERVEAALDGVEHVRLVFADPHGLARGKILPRATFRSVLRNGMDFSAGPFVLDTGHGIAVDFLSDDPGVGVGELAGAGDFVVVPDPRTFQLLPDVEPATAWVLGDEYLRDGSPHPLSSRAVLKRVVEQFTRRDLTPVVGLEVEWYLTRRLPGHPSAAGNGFGDQAQAPAVAPIDAGYQFNLESGLDRAAEITGPLSAAVAELGLPLRSMELESGPGQLEFTFDPMTASDTADAMLLFRTVAKQLCARRGLHASFMALPGLPGFDPSGWHIHQSVLETRTGRNLFAFETDLLSPDGERYVDGMLALTRQLCLLSVPTVNGYRRLRPGPALSPSCVDSRTENRSALVRILGSGPSAHAENRIAEPAANPYLAIAAQLYAGLAGLDGDPPGGGTELPGSLRDALESFRGSKAADDLLGTPLAALLTKLKDSELTRFEKAAGTGEDLLDGEVTDWEHREYFDVY